MYFDYFGILCILEKSVNQTKSKSITRSISRIQSDDSVVCGFCYIAHIEYMISGKNLLIDTKVISPNIYKK